MSVMPVMVVLPAMLKVLVLFFAVAMGTLNVFGHIVRSDPDQGAFFHEFECLGEKDAPMPCMVTFDSGGAQHQIGIASHILKYDACHAEIFEVVDDLTAALKGIVPERDLSCFVDQGKPFGFAEQWRYGALMRIGFDGYSDHAKSFVMIFTHLETIFLVTRRNGFGGFSKMGISDTCEGGNRRRL